MLRSDQAVLRCQKRIVGLDRLARDHVHGGSGQLAGVQRFGQVLLDDKSSARRVDQKCTRPGEPEPLPIDQPGGLFRERIV